VSASKEKSDFNGFILYALIRFADLDGEFAELFDILRVDKLNIPLVRDIEDDSHDSLACANRTVDFGVDFI
jgi:hypothetical protein